MSTSVPQSYVATQSKNKVTHPGLAVKGLPHQTIAKVQQECAMKAQAKAAWEETKQQGINRAAEFEHENMANEDIIDATPCPQFTPKAQLAPHNQRNTSTNPATNTSNLESTYMASPSKKSVTDDITTASENDSLPPPIKRCKTQGKATMKTVLTAGTKCRRAEKADKTPTSDGELPEEPKLKKAKIKVQDEIDMAMKKIQGEVGNSRNYAREDAKPETPAPS